MTLPATARMKLTPILPSLSNLTQGMTARDLEILIDLAIAAVFLLAAILDRPDKRTPQKRLVFTLIGTTMIVIAIVRGLMKH